MRAYTFVYVAGEISACECIDPCHFLRRALFFFPPPFLSIAMIGVGRPIYYEVRRDTNTMATILLFAQGVIVRLIFIFSV